MDNRKEIAANIHKTMTNWKNPPSLEELKADLLEAKPMHDAQVTQISEWLDNLHVRGKAKIKTGKNNSKIVPKLIRKQAEWRYPALSEPFLSTEDLFNVRPVTWEDRDAAQQNQLVLNHQFNTQINKVAFVDKYVRAGVDEGTIIVRLGWEFEEEDYEAQEPVVQFQVNPDMLPVHEDLARMQQESPSQYQTDIPDELKQAHELTMENGVPVEPVIMGYQTVTKQRTVYNRPTWEICDYHNVVIDPSCRGDINKARFACYSFESSLSLLKKDKRYKNLEYIDLDGSSVLNTPDHTGPEKAADFNFADKARKKFVVQEYWGWWDIDGTGLVKPFVAAWAGGVLIRLEENPFPDKALPFVVVPFLPVKDSTHGEPDGALLEDNQKIIGAVVRGMIDIMGKSANGQTGIRKDALDVTNRRRFDAGLDYEFNPNVDPRQGIYMHTYPEIPQSAQFMLSLQNMEAESLTGVKAFSQGVSGASLGDVAAGVRGALDASSKRELAILRRLSQGMIEIGRKTMAMNAEFLSDVEVVRITNDEFVAVRRDDLPGNFDLRLSISTAEEDNNKAQELAFMLQTMGNNMDPEMSKMILADIARLRKMPDLAKKIEQYSPQPDPLLQEKARLEVELLKRQIATEEAKAMQFQASAQLDSAKSGTEQVKQGNLQSDTDLKNLEFIEQESGVHQERELQKQQMQSNNQRQLKELDRIKHVEGKQFDLIKQYLANKKTSNKE